MLVAASILTWNVADCLDRVVCRVEDGEEGGQHTEHHPPHHHRDGPNIELILQKLSLPKIDENDEVMLEARTRETLKVTCCYVIYIEDSLLCMEEEILFIKQPLQIH